MSNIGCYTGHLSGMATSTYSIRVCACPSKALNMVTFSGSVPSKLILDSSGSSQKMIGCHLNSAYKRKNPCLFQKSPSLGPQAKIKDPYITYQQHIPNLKVFFLNFWKECFRNSDIIALVWDQFQSFITTIDQVIKETSKYVCAWFPWTWIPKSAGQVGHLCGQIHKLET